MSLNMSVIFQILELLTQLKIVKSLQQRLRMFLKARNIWNSIQNLPKFNKLPYNFKVSQFSQNLKELKSFEALIKDRKTMHSFGRNTQRHAKFLQSFQKSSKLSQHLQKCSNFYKILQNYATACNVYKSFKSLITNFQFISGHKWLRNCNLR